VATGVITFIGRRLVAAVLIVLAASFITYLLMANAGDPLAFTIEITDATEREAVRAAVSDQLNLDVNPIARYFLWLGDVVRGDFGVSARTQEPVSEELATRLPLTLKLVGAAFVLSVLVGTSVGVVSAIRQYSGLDYLATFFTFVFFSLPVFWVAVILKATGGINFNDWLREGAEFSTGFVVVAAIVVFVVVSSISGGSRARRAGIAAATTASVVALLVYVSRSGWMLDPRLGPVVVAGLSIAIAYGVTAVLAGTRNRKALYSSMATAAIGIIGYFPLQLLFDSDAMNLWILIGLGAASIALGIAVGYAFGGYDRGLSAATAAVVAFGIGVLLFVDRAMRSWQEYSSTSVIRNRPIKTIGDREPRLEGSFWVITNDTFSHLVLPTIALMLISLATYTRYSRSSMLEVLNQDYIRTARAKGLTERTVVVRHALRNALIPLATVLAVDIGALLGGAVITEAVFEWDGMGRLFQEGLRALDPNPVMAFVVVVAVCTVLTNLIADLMYVVLDPRIRLTD
jgi:peptide/nickel transport system permease protein